MTTQLLRQVRCFLILLTGAVVLGEQGCKENPADILPPTNHVNVPAISNTTDSLTFAVNADQFTHSQSLALTFTEPQLGLQFTASGFAGGSAIIAISDSFATIRIDTIRSDTTLTSIRLVERRPRFFTVALNGFTGALSFNVCRELAIPPMQITEFPYRQGAQWRYQVKDLAFSSPTDTVLVSAVRDTNVDGRLAVLWKTSFSARAESMFVIRSDDSLWMVDRLPTDFGLNDVAFPLWFGKTWYSNRVAADTSIVVAIDPVVVPARSFARCYVVDQKWQVTVSVVGRNTAWLAPGVGIVQLYRSSSAPFRLEEWKLIDYSIP